jgi:NAD(P)-dependent dehydrogenase (short-subunit alcohol dehydrogenase family)
MSGRSGRCRRPFGSVIKKLEGAIVSELRFDGQVAIVTGAGGSQGLGRSHAMLLAARGAKVVVNDLGVGPDGRGLVRADAETVAEEIRAAGGEAIADTNSVAEQATAEAVVETALNQWGRVDILVNNAGICAMAPFEELDPRDVERMVAVHVLGSIWMCRAVWPHMRQASYGRIVNTSSGGAFGFRALTVYGAAKGGIFALTRNLAAEGTELGIHINSIGPQAGTGATSHLSEGSGEWYEAMFTQFTPERVAAVVAYLTHERCAVSGRYFEVGGGHVAERFVSDTRGFTGDDLTPEEMDKNIDTVLDRTDATVLPEPSVPVDAPFRPKPYTVPVA